MSAKDYADEDHQEPRYDLETAGSSGERLVGSYAKPQTVNIRTARHIDRSQSGAELRGNRGRRRLLLQNSHRSRRSPH